MFDAQLLPVYIHPVVAILTVLLAVDGAADESRAETNSVKQLVKILGMDLSFSQSVILSGLFCAARTGMALALTPVPISETPYLPEKSLFQNKLKL